MSSSNRSSKESKRKLVLGTSGFVTDEEQRNAAREFFLYCVQEHAPQVLQDLHGAASIQTWAHSHHLTFEGRVPDWIIEQAEGTLRSWDTVDLKGAGKRWGGFEGERTIPVFHLCPIPAPLEVVTIESDAKEDQEHLPIDTQCIAWIPNHESANVVRDALLELSRRCKAMANTKDLLRFNTKKGWQKVQQMDRDHFNWAASYQCGGMEVHQIANSPCEQQTVGVAIREILRLVALTRRRGRGRPRKS